MEKWTSLFAIKECWEIVTIEKLIFLRITVTIKDNKLRAGMRKMIICLSIAILIAAC